MITTTHALLSAAIWARPGRPRTARVAIAGAIAPDLFMFGLFFWALLAEVPQDVLWREIYYSAHVQTLAGFSHSAPVWAGLALAAAGLGWWACRAGGEIPSETSKTTPMAAPGTTLETTPTLALPLAGGGTSGTAAGGKGGVARGGDNTAAWPALLLVFALSGLLHLAGDLPLHAEDAHRHLWPLSDWRFISPVSYWDPAHYGRIAAPIEALFAAGLIVLLWRRFAGLIPRLALGLAAVPPLMVGGLLAAALAGLSGAGQG